MRYFFHIRDDRGFVRDEEGTELPNMAAARQEARFSAFDFAMDDMRGGEPIAERCIEIADAKGCVLATMPVRDIVK